MKAMLYEIFLHMKLNVRSKELLVHYYIVPFIFYILMIFPSFLKSTDPAYPQNIQIHTHIFLYRDV